MAATSTSKKVLVSRFERETLQGFVNPQTYLAENGVELLTASGTVQIVAYTEIKLVCFVRDWGQGEPRRELRMFNTRPKMAGLWVRMMFRDGEALDGILANNLLALESAGFSIIPPDPSFQNQRVFVPKQALSSMMVMGVVGTPLRQPRKSKAPEKEEQQIQLFE